MEMGRFPFFRSLLLLLLGVLAGPQHSLAHGAEFLFAKLSLCRDGKCQLEVTADYGDNPMLHDEGDARAAIAGLLRLADAAAAGGMGRPLGTVVFEKRAQLDPTTPGFQSFAENRGAHRLLTGIWRWQPEGRTVEFQVTPGTPFDALLWVVHESPKTAESPRWAMLIAGDHSPIIPLDLVPERGGAAGSLIGLSVIILGIGTAGFLGGRNWFQRRILPATAGLRQRREKWGIGARKNNLSLH